MSDIKYDPVPLGPAPARSAPDLSSLGLLPPLPKPTQPVEPRPAPKPEMPAVKSEAVIETPIPAPPLPGKLAWIPEAIKALVIPSKQKGIIAAGLVSLIAGATVANMLWPTPKPIVEVAKVEPASLPTVLPTAPVEPKPAIEFPRAELPEPGKLSPSTGVIDLSHLPPLLPAAPDGNVRPAGGVALPDLPAAPPSTAPALPPIALPTTSAAPPPVTLPNIKLPDVKLPELPPVAVHSPPSISVPSSPTVGAPPLPTVSAPPLPVVTAPTMPEIKVSPLPTMTIPETKPAAPPPILVIPETKPATPPVLPESKPASLPVIPETKPASPPVIPDPREPVFVPTGTAKPTPYNPPPAPRLESPPEPQPLKPASAMTPREDYDVDVHYIANGDTWASISKQHLGDERYADALKTYNGNRALTANQTVDVPPLHVLRKQYSQQIAAPRPADPVPAPAPVAPRSNGLRSYEIPAGGMTLKDVAKKALGDENYWGQIWELNPKLRADEPVPAGTKIKLPSDSRIGE